MNLNNRVKNRFEISEILKKLLIRLKKVESNSTPATQVNSDWNATSGVAQILNKPLVLDRYTSNITSNGSFTVNITADFLDIIVQNQGNNTTMFLPLPSYTKDGAELSYTFLQKSATFSVGLSGGSLVGNIPTSINAGTTLKFKFVQATNTFYLLEIGTNTISSYSTSEKVVGTWITGKPIYRRVITGTTDASGWWQMLQLQTSLSLKDFVSMNVLQLGGGGNYATTKTAVNNSGSLIVIPSSVAGATPWIGVQSYLGTSASPVSITFAVILEYTKTTD